VNSGQLWTTVSGQTRPGADRVVLLHGFTQTSFSWKWTADHLVADAEAVRVDLPGHGRSDAVSADLPGTAGLTCNAAGPGVYIGYSMGARVALHCALLRPDLVRGLILVGGTAGIDDDHERLARRQADETLAQKVQRVGVASFLEDWLRGPLFQTLRPSPHDLEERRTNTAEGLAMSLRRCGTGSQEPLWDRLRNLAIPTLVVAGEYDTKFTGIGRRLVDTIGPAAELSVVAGAGHAVHLERPDEFLAHAVHALERIRSR